MKKTTIKLEIEREKKEALKDLWKDYSNELKNYTTRQDLYDYLVNQISVDNWDNVIWTSGFIRGLEIALSISKQDNLK